MARVPGKITTGLLALGLVRSLWAASPAPELPSLFHIQVVRLEPNDWQRLLGYFKEPGPRGPNFTPSDGYMPATYGFEDIHGKRGEPHKADYLNLWGYENEGRFAPYEVKLVSEDWRAFKPEYTQDQRAKESCAKRACLFIDQWIISLDLSGNKTGSYHGSVIEDASATVFGGDTFQASDAETKAQLEKLLTQWKKILDARFNPRP